MTCTCELYGYCIPCRREPPAPRPQSNLVHIAVVLAAIFESRVNE